MHIFNFPTKLSLANPGSTCAYYRINEDSPFWLKVNNKCEVYTRNIYDLSENTPTELDYPFSPKPAGTKVSMCGEVEFNIQMSSNPAYTEGWIRYTHATAAGTKIGFTKSGDEITFTGVPVLSSVLFWSFDRENPAEANAAYTDGVVTVAGSALPYYQYSE